MHIKATWLKVSRVRPRHFVIMALQFSTEGLAAEWDAEDSIRLRLRSGKHLENVDCGEDPCNRAAVLNMQLLVPVLVRMKACDLHLPSVDALRVEVKAVYDLSQRIVEETRVDDSAWFIRRMVVFVKRKTQKELVSLVASLG